MNILLAEDDAISRKLVETNLRKWGHNVLSAEDGEQALKIFNETPSIKLAILDWMMPKMDGLQVCQEIKSRKDQSFVYTIMLTAKSANEDIVEALDGGADDFITKPFNKDELQARVNAGIRIIRLEEALLNTIGELEDALAHVKKLQGILPICSWCKKIRNDSDYWQSVEEYLGELGNPKFTHSICPECLAKHYPEEEPATK